MAGKNNFPKLHNAMWPGLVGRGSKEIPAIELDTMIDLTVKAEVNGVKFDGIDIFHAAPHTNIDFSDDEVKKLAAKAQKNGLAIGSIVAPVWPPVGGGSAMGSASDRKKFVANVEKSCRLGARLRELGVRPSGVGAHRLGHQHGRMGERPRRQHQEDRQDISRGLQRCLRLWRAPGLRGRDLLGRHELVEGHDRHPRGNRSSADHRLPGRHGPHAALHHGLQRARNRACFRPSTTGRTRPFSTKP